ncbi:helix-turn-helix domain-containing protein [Rhizobium sp. C4]|uniref:helix-turn-helix domain-containing protein n=1 Tax=Rhizobium sp. C4 TaxID=1349800 RepID=UPI001E3C66B4|nr:helix-turn-helix domain-containing protein [Rhizobium sp. C4]MCD2175559.1 transposase [Rhizobium sp. C4]
MIASKDQEREVRSGRGSDRARDRRPPLSALRETRPERVICQSVRLMTAEFLFVSGDRIGMRRERRRLACHIRQIAMYVCHVALQMRMTTIGEGFGRDRSTVAHACAVVEDRRDDRDFDEFVSAIERIVVLAFGHFSEVAHD